jgi:hypothetical protein
MLIGDGLSQNGEQNTVTSAADGLYVFLFDSGQPEE